MSLKNVNFDEARQSQLPFVELLLNMGYKYISASDVMRERRDDTRRFILRDIAQKTLMNINEYEYNGEKYKFSSKDVDEAISELENIQFEGLMDTSAKVYKMIMPLSGGKTIKVMHNGKNVSKSFRFIDFENIENNVFHVTVEFEANGKSNIRPDIVVFINGIPFAIIENKKASIDIEEALKQMNRNQTVEYCPKLFVYPQLLIGANGQDFCYGTTGTPNEFYARWKEKDNEDKIESKAKKLIRQKIYDGVYKTVCDDLNGATKNHKQKIDRDVTDQDRGVVVLFSKERLLDLTKNFILYDAGIKKVMRYQQYFAVKKIQERIKHKMKGVDGDRREGGLLWHTQGSGKSLTMVMFVRALIEDPNIVNPRILIVTDRKDLDRQIKNTFQNAGLKKEVMQASSGAHLLKLIKDKELAVVTTLIHKFQSASKQKANFVDKDKNIFVLIDEAHRSQGGEANLEMNRIIPNACYIAFTGTPLLKKEKSRQKFGTFIDKYTIDDALEDGIILPLIYQGRFVDFKQNKEEIDRLSERLTKNMSDIQKQKLQQSTIEKKVIADNPHRIVEIAYDIEKHFLAGFKDTGLKAQIVAPSKYSATLFQKCFSYSGKIQTALVISDENGIINDKDEHKKEVDTYLRKIKEKYQSLKSYEESVVDSFKYNEDGVEILIVVDKLLTGFDAPRNTVLYLTKELRDHNLLQAIARVNRLYDNKVLPKTAGYVVDYSENATNIQTAMQLFGNYDIDDVQGALIDVKQKTSELEAEYSILNDLFKDVKKDDEAYIAYLSDEQKRKEFYDVLRKFMTGLNECMNLQDFAISFNNIDLYRNELRKYMELRKIVNAKYAEEVDFSKYKIALTKILDDNIKAKEAELLTKEITITDKEKFNEVIEELGSDKSKAEAIAYQTQKTISENLQKDPEFYRTFSKKISELLEQMRQKKLEDIEVLKQVKEISEIVINKKDNNIPKSFATKKGANILYRNIVKKFEEVDVKNKQLEKIILRIYDLVNENSVVDWWKNVEQKRRMREAVDDYLYDEVYLQMGVKLSAEKMQQIIDIVMKLAQNNHDIFRL